MVQFYISSGVIIASIVLQILLIKNSIYTNRLISYDDNKRAKKVNLTAANSLDILKWSTLFSVLLSIWSLILSLLFKELFISIVFLTLLIAIILAVLVYSNLLNTIGLKNEVQLAHTKNMKYSFSEDIIKQLKAIDSKLTISYLVIGFTNTIGLVICYMVFHDNLLVNLVNVLLTVIAYYIVYKSLDNQRILTFSQQEATISEEDLDKYIQKAKNEDTLSKKDMENMLEEIKQEKEQKE